MFFSNFGFDKIFNIGAYPQKILFGIQEGEQYTSGCAFLVTPEASLFFRAPFESSAASLVPNFAHLPPAVLFHHDALNRFFRNLQLACNLYIGFVPPAVYRYIVLLLKHDLSLYAILFNSLVYTYI